MNTRTFGPSLRLSAMLLLVGQLLYIVITLLHTGGDANNHPAIFEAYAASRNWTAVHLGQFAAMAILLAGLFALFFALDIQAGTASWARWAGRFGAAAAVAALALYGVLQAVDGVANKRADSAWVSAPETEKAARFASAEAIRWIEWGLRSYQNVALGLAVLLFAVAVMRTARIPGYDAHKWMRWCKHHLLIDVRDLPTVSHATPADVHDTVGARDLLVSLAEELPVKGS